MDLGQAELPKHVNGDAFLSPLTIDEHRDPIGPCASQGVRRFSDKGFLAMSLEDYLELLDWSARQVAPGKRGKTPENLPPVLKRLGLDRDSSCELVSDFGKLFCTVAGRPEQVDLMRSHRTHRRYHLRRRARELFAEALVLAFDVIWCELCVGRIGFQPVTILDGQAGSLSHEANGDLNGAVQSNHNAYIATMGNSGVYINAGGNVELLAKGNKALDEYFESTLSSFTDIADGLVSTHDGLWLLETWVV